MANRVVRDWTCSETISSISEGAEVFFTRLIMKADDFGCYYGSLKIVKSQLYPLREKKSLDIESHIQELHEAKVIVIYYNEGKRYLSIPNFGQRLRAMNRKFPDPADSCLTDDSHVTAEEKEEKEENRIETPPTPKGEDIDFDILLKTINQIFGRKFEVVNDSIKKKYKKLLKQGYKKPNIMQAMRACQKDPYHIEQNYKYCTLEYFSRPNVIDMHGTLPTVINPSQFKGATSAETNDPNRD